MFFLAVFVVTALALIGIYFFMETLRCIRVMRHLLNKQPVPRRAVTYEVVKAVSGMMIVVAVSALIILLSYFKF